MKIKVLSVLIAGIMLLSAVACGQKTDVDSTSSVSISENLESKTESDKDKNDEITNIRNSYMDAADKVVVDENSVTFTDDSGRESITINKNPKKVAILYASHTCLWYEAGGVANGVIGGKSAIELYNEQIGRDITQDAGMEVLATSSSAKTWKIENIIATKPDIIICSTAMSGYKTIKDAAENANIPVIAVKYSGLSDYLKWFKVFCNINSKPELWDTVANKTLDKVAETIVNIPTYKSPKVVSLLASTDGKSKVNCKSTDMGALISELKATNIADKWDKTGKATRLDLNMEALYAENPDIILIQCISSEDLAKEIVERDFSSNPVWKELQAVKNNKVYFMPNNLFHHRPNGKYGEAYAYMADVLYNK